MSFQSVAKNFTPQYLAYHDTWDNCEKCALHQCARQKVHFRGEVPAHILFIGEAPGEGDDETGLPFTPGDEVGKMLDDVIAASQPDRDFALRICITNTVLCWPGHNNVKPSPEERNACAYRLGEFLKLVRPKLVVLVGKQAFAGFVRAQLAADKVYRSVEIKHPSYILLQRENKELEKQRAITALKNAIGAVFK